MIPTPRKNPCVGAKSLFGHFLVIKPETSFANGYFERNIITWLLLPTMQRYIIINRGRIYVFFIMLIGIRRPFSGVVGFGEKTFTNSGVPWAEDFTG